MHTAIARIPKHLYRCLSKCIFAVVFICGAGASLAVGSESDLDDPLELLPQNPPQHTESNHAPKDKQSDKSSSANTQAAQVHKPDSSTDTARGDLGGDSNASGAATNTKNTSQEKTTQETENFLAVQKQFPWIKSVGLVMVSFDDGSFRSGFGLLLPEQIFLTSAQLAHSAQAYPKNILLKMRDESAGNLICVAELRLKAVDKILGLALFEVSAYTDDHCNLRSQSYYHSKILSQAYDITKHKGTPKSTKDHNYYSVTTTFDNPNISVLTIDSVNNTSKTPQNRTKAQPQKLPIEDEQPIIFGRPFFAKSGSLLGIATMPNNAISPVIVGDGEIKKFLCEIDKSGFIVASFVAEICK